MFVQDLVIDLNQIHVENTLGFDQHTTREGFLLCRNVAINRTGWQDYLNDEIVGEDQTDDPLYAARSRDGVIRAFRDEKDVFRPETLASFEGKDVVDDHPEDAVTPLTYKEVTVGVMLNVHRGEGALADCTLADLLIKDANAIAAVREGKRQVSCGYEADYEVIGPGKVRQFNIIGNHVALVDRGRCGSRCAIGDEDMTQKVTVKKDSLVHRVLAAIVNKDRSALTKAMDEMEKGEEKEKDEAPEAAVMEATGTHIHLHLPGEAQAAGGDIPPAADEEADPDEEKKKKEQEDKAMGDWRAGVDAFMAKMDKAMDRLLGGPVSDAKEEEGEEEAEGEVPEKDAAEVEEEPKNKDKKTTGDKAVKDSTDLKDAHKAALSDTEILAPGLKLPVFDSAAPRTATLDSICLLKRRAIAAALRDDKNGGAEAVKAVIGDAQFNGMACDKLAVVFNGAVALMRDRNEKDDETKKNLGRARPKDKQAPAVAAPTSPRDLNNQMRERYKQPTRV